MGHTPERSPSDMGSVGVTRGSTMDGRAGLDAEVALGCEDGDLTPYPQRQHKQCRPKCTSSYSSPPPSLSVSASDGDIPDSSPGEPSPQNRGKGKALLTHLAAVIPSSGASDSHASFLNGTSGAEVAPPFDEVETQWHDTMDEDEDTRSTGPVRRLRQDDSRLATNTTAGKPTTTPTPPTLDDLPNEVLVQTLSFLDVDDLLSMSRTCHHLRNLCLHPYQHHLRLRFARSILPLRLSNPCRPSLPDLVRRRIYLTTVTILSNKLARSLISIRLSRRLAARPTAEQLVERAVLPVGMEMVGMDISRGVVIKPGMEGSKVGSKAVVRGRTSRVGFAMGIGVREPGSRRNNMASSRSRSPSPLPLVPATTSTGKTIATVGVEKTGPRRLIISPSIVAKRREVERAWLKDRLRRWVGTVWRPQVGRRGMEVGVLEEARGVGRVWRLTRFWEGVSREGGVWSG